VWYRDLPKGATTAGMISRLAWLRGGHESWHQHTPEHQEPKQTMPAGRHPRSEDPANQQHEADGERTFPGHRQESLKNTWCTSALGVAITLPAILAASAVLRLEVSLDEVLGGRVAGLDFRGQACLVDQQKIRNSFDLEAVGQRVLARGR
jgi:hypothetical protein